MTNDIKRALYFFIPILLFGAGLVCGILIKGSEVTPVNIPATVTTTVNSTTNTTYNKLLLSAYAFYIEGVEDRIRIYESLFFADCADELIKTKLEVEAEILSIQTHDGLWKDYEGVVDGNIIRDIVYDLRRLQDRVTVLQKR